MSRRNILLFVLMGVLVFAGLDASARRAGSGQAGAAWAFILDLYDSIRLEDNQATAAVIESSDGTDLMTFTTTNSAEKVTVDADLDVDGTFTITGPLAFTGTNIDLDPTGTFTLDLDVGMAATFTLDDMANGMVIQAAGGENLLALSYSAGDKSIVLGNATDDPVITQLGAGQVTFVGNVDAGRGLDVSGGDFTSTGGIVDLDPTGAVTVDLAAGMAATWTLADMDASMVLQAGGGENLLVFNYSAGTKSIILGNATDNPQITQLGTGQVTFAGNVDAGLGLDVTGGDFTAAGGIVDLDPTGVFSLDMDAAQTATITLADNLDAALLVQEAANGYLEIDTQNGTEVMNFGNATTNPDFIFLGSGSFTPPSGSIDSTEIADLDRFVTLSIPGTMTDCAGTPQVLDPTAADAHPDLGLVGAMPVLVVDATGGSVDTNHFCWRFDVPADFGTAGAVSFTMRVAKSAETGANTEILGCDVAENGGALSGSPDSDTITGAGAQNLDIHNAAWTAGFAASDIFVLDCVVTSSGTADDDVYVYDVKYNYTGVR